jgi:hypothetical protein
LDIDRELVERIGAPFLSLRPRREGRLIDPTARDAAPLAIGALGVEARLRSRAFPSRCNMVDGDSRLVQRSGACPSGRAILDSAADVSMQRIAPRSILVARHHRAPCPGKRDALRSIALRQAASRRHDHGAPI